MTKNLLTTRQLAIRLGLATITLHIWRRKGIGVAFQRIGPRVFYRLADVQAYERYQVQGLIDYVLGADQPLPTLRTLLHSNRIPRHRARAPVLSVCNTGLFFSPRQTASERLPD
jgi:hypothetical protein